MKYFAYMILFPNGYLYTGSTGNLDRRRREHRRNVGKGAKVVFKEVFESRDEAVVRERQLKGWSRAKKEALISVNEAKLVTLAKRRSGNLFQRPV
jgi:putative endonuclease